MSKSTNTVAVGAFVAGAFAILFAILFLLTGDLFRRDVDSALVVFDGSLKGLNVGAAVAFKGVQIGEVEDFDVYVDSETLQVLTPVRLRVYTDRIKRTDGSERSENDVQHMIDKGLRAQLQLQSLLTGLLYIQLDFYPESTANYRASDLEKYDIPDDVIIIPTIPRELEKLARGLQEIDFAGLAANANKTLEGMNKLVNNPEFQALPDHLKATLAAVEQLSRRLDAEVQSLSPELNALVADSGGAMKTLNRELPALSADTRAAVAQLKTTLETAQTALNSIDYVMSDDSAVLYDVREAARELGRAGQALQSLAETLETQPEALIKGKAASQ